MKIFILKQFFISLICKIHIWLKSNIKRIDFRFLIILITLYNLILNIFHLHSIDLLELFNINFKNSFILTYWMKVYFQWLASVKISLLFNFIKIVLYFYFFLFAFLWFNKFCLQCLMKTKCNYCFYRITKIFIFSY